MVNGNDSLPIIGTSTLPSPTLEVNNNTLGGYQVSVIVNNIWPYEKAAPRGPNGVNYYSSWQFVINPDYTRITEGLNRITAKLSCPSNNNT
jgi:hypothetical protein